MENSECKTSSKAYKYLMQLITVIAIITLGVLILSEIKKMRQGNNTISVKGLAERAVKADFSIWIIPIASAVSDDLAEARAKIEMDTAKIIKFLKSHGLEDKDISQDVMKILDRSAQKYYDENNKAKRFIIDHQIIVKTTNVDAVEKANHNLNELISEGVLMAYDGYQNNTAPQYLFTKLNEIKPQMLSDAVVEAKRAASEIANSSGINIGDVKNIVQGQFSVYSREALANSTNAAYAGAAYYNNNEILFVNKIVRIVVSAEYRIDQ